MNIRNLFKKKNRWDSAMLLINEEEQKKREFNNKLYELVYNYPTKSQYGFNSIEQKELLKQFPDINMNKYEDALMGITCMMDENGFIIYHCDILTALKCGIENREMTVEEWD